MTNLPQQNITGTLLSLPPELLISIFSYIDDLDDLRSFSRSRHYVSKIYGASRSSIKSQVLANFLPTDAIETAKAAVAVGCLSRHPKSNILRSIIGTSLEDLTVSNWSHLSTSLTTPAAIRLHRQVKFFTNLIFEQATQTAVDLEGVSLGSPLTDEEKSRIMRALYRYQFICTLTQIDHETCKPYYVLNSTYWAKSCTVWEMEEMGCIYDILCAQYEGHQDVLGNILKECRDFFQKVYKVHMAVDPTRSWVKLSAQQARRYLMSLGLPFLYGLLTARSSTDRQMLVSRHHLDAETMLYANATIAEVPCALPKDRLTDAIAGTAQGPNAGWQWANSDKLQEVRDDEEDRLKFSSDYYQVSFATQRAWGYCLWGRERLEEWATG